MSATPTRRAFALSLLAAPLWPAPFARAGSARQARIRDFGAVPDGETVNTAAIQAAIEDLAARGGGTVIIPAGIFVSGALFLKPGVNLHLARGAVLRCSTKPRSRQ